jgi:predicted acyltransferase
MTTIILTIIGILLAAAAALMVIFYGGDAFNAGSVGARANTLQNAGTNVLSAIQLYRADGKLVSAITSTNDLMGAGDANYLKEMPSFSSVNPDTAPVATTVGSVFHVTNVPDAVCARVNKNLGLGTGAISEATTIKMGCDTTSKIFFANA